MRLLEERRAAAKERMEEDKRKLTQEIEWSVNVFNKSSIIYNTVWTVKKSAKCYTTFTLKRYPTGVMALTISKRRNFYPFNFYYERTYLIYSESDVPATHKSIFEELLKELDK